MMKLFYNFLFHNKQKALTIQALFLAARMRFIVRFFPESKLHRFMGEKGVETSHDDIEDTEKLQKIRWISIRVNRVANRVPWESKCLVRALVAQRLLLRQGLASTMYLGVRLNEEQKMAAHAWLRCGPYYVTGGNGEEFTTVACFARQKHSA